MPRLRHAQTGAVVNVSDATAARMGSEWKPLVDKKQAPAKKAASKSPDSNN